MTSARYKMKNKKTETLTLHSIIRKVCTQTMGRTKRGMVFASLVQHISSTSKN